MGPEGLLVFSKNNKQCQIDRLNAINVDVVDESGAGDSLLALSTMVFSITGNIWLSSFIGSIAASVQIGRRGNVH